MKTRTLTHARLLELLRYDPDTGEFTWKINRRKIKAGSVAGRTHKSGYRVITVDNVRQYAHRLAWLYMTGSWPRLEVDHRNCVRSDNRWKNLRKATRPENGWNARARASVSGIKGIDFHKLSSTWRARCTVAGVRHLVGHFHDLELAELVVKEFRDSKHGAFSRHA